MLEKSEGAPLISIAAYFGSFNCYEYFLSTYIDIPNFKYSLLAYACAGGNMSIIRDVESRYPDLLDEENKSNIDNLCNPGFQAIYHGHLDVVKWLFLKGYIFDMSEILIACSHGYEKIFDFLTENLKIVENKEFFYDEMIQTTCYGGNVNILQKLMANYPQKKIPKKKYQRFIDYSISEGNTSCLKYLLKYSKVMFPRIWPSFIQSALAYASFYEYIDIIQYLVRLGGTFDGIESPNSPLISSLISGSESTAKFYLKRLPKIPTDQINKYFRLIFQTEYSYPIIQLLLQYIEKTLFDYKEMFTQLAVDNDVFSFFDDLKADEISFDFINIEVFDHNTDKYDLFIKIYELGAPLKFDISNKVFLTALKSGNEDFVSFAISNVAILNDDIVEASGCLNYDSRFYKKEDLIELLFKFNIDLSRYPDFLQLLIISCGSKTYVYEELALEALKRGAIINRNAAIETVKIKWSRLFNRIYEKNNFEIGTENISLGECRFNKYAYKEILYGLFFIIELDL